MKNQKFIVIALIALVSFPTHAFDFFGLFKKKKPEAAVRELEPALDLRFPDIDVTKITPLDPERSAPILESFPCELEGKVLPPLVIFGEHHYLFSTSEFDEAFEKKQRRRARFKEILLAHESMVYQVGSKIYHPQLNAPVGSPLDDPKIYSREEFYFGLSTSLAETMTLSPGAYYPYHDILLVVKNWEPILINQVGGFFIAITSNNYPEAQEAWKLMKRPFVNSIEEKIARIIDEQIPKSNLSKARGELWTMFEQTGAQPADFLPVMRRVIQGIIYLSRTKYKESDRLPDLSRYEKFLSEERNSDVIPKQLMLEGEAVFLTYRDEVMASNLAHVYCASLALQSPLPVVGIVGSAHLPGVKAFFQKLLGDFADKVKLSAVDRHAADYRPDPELEGR